MDNNRILEHIKTILLVIMAVLLIYLFIVMWIYFNSETVDTIESVRGLCNNFALMDQGGRFCCEKRVVFIGGEGFEATCSSLKNGGFLKDIKEFDCDSVSCF